VSSVVGSAMAVLLAIAAGFAVVLYSTLGLYVLAGLLLLYAALRNPWPPAA